MPHERRWGKDAFLAALAIVAIVVAVVLLRPLRHQWSAARTARYLKVNGGYRRVACTPSKRGRPDLSPWDYVCRLWPAVGGPPELIGVDANDSGITDYTSP